MQIIDRWIGFVFGSIRNKVLLSLVCFILIPYSLIFYYYQSFTEKVTEQNIYQSNQELVQQQANAINDLTARMLRASTLLNNDGDVLQYLEKDANWNESYEASRRLTTLQNKLLTIRDILVDENAFLSIIDFRGYAHTTWHSERISEQFKEFDHSPWFDKTIALNGRPNWTLPYREWMNDGDNNEERNLLMLSRLIKGDRSTGGFGLVFIAIPDRSLLPVSDFQSTTGMKTFLVSDNGETFGREEDEPLIHLYMKQVQDVMDKRNQVDLDGQPFMVNTVSLSEMNWQVVQLIPRQHFISQLQQVKDRSLSLMIVWFVVFAIVFITVMFRFIRPIRSLTLSIKRLGKGNFESKIQVSGRDEISQLGLYFNTMLDQLKESIAQASEEQRNKEDARFQALQAQINPHFLFNTLSSIKWRAMMSGDEHVSQMITTLGRLLEFSMRHDREAISIGEELEYLEMYMKIQEIRYHDLVVLHIDVPEDLKSYRILKFTLQPIVENSIIHGHRQQLRIVITGDEQEEFILLRITDNGIGVSEEKLREIQISMQQPHAKFSGIGIHNVHERIRRYYGDHYGIEMTSEPDNGTVTTIRIPKHRGETI
jgi:two-component system sensor histidine kinase YesM